jgi:putrescine transport system ATP-binding protein
MELQRKLGTSFVIVTHDQDEAMTVADRIAVMDHGRVAQVGKPAEVYERPASRWVADFIGEVTLLEGRFSAPGVMQTMIGQLRVSDPSVALGATVWLGLRPEKIDIGSERPADDINAVAGTLHEVGYRGDMSIFKVRLGDRSLMKVTVANTAHGRRGFAAGDVVWLSWPADAGVVLTQ